MSARLDTQHRQRPIRAAVAWWFEPVPTRRIELCRRITFGYAAAWLILRGSYVWDVASLSAQRFQPVGVLAWLDDPPPRPTVVIVSLLTVVASVLVCTGWAPRITTSIASGGMLVIATFTSSFGQVFHTEHLLVIHLLVLAAGNFDETRGSTTQSGWPLKLMISCAVVTYVLAGIAKLRYGGGGWLHGDALKNWVAADNLRKALLDDPSSTIGGWLAGVAWVWRPIALFTLIVELGAPIALRSGPLRSVWITGSWLFHVGIYALMAISFPYQLSGVAYVAFMRVEEIEAWIRSRRGAQRAARPREVRFTSTQPRSRRGSRPRSDDAGRNAPGRPATPTSR